MVLGHYADWLVSLVQSSSTRWPGFRDGWTLWLVASHLGQNCDWRLLLEAPIVSVGYAVLQFMAAVLTLIWCLWQQSNGLDRRRLVCVSFAMTMVWLMLFGPAVEQMTYTFLAPSLAWALLERRGRWLSAGAFVLIALLGWDPLIHSWIDRAPVLLAALPAGTVLFVVWLIGWTWRAARRKPAGERPAGLRRAARLILQRSKCY